MLPLCSSAGMKACGPTTPCSGWSQRARASAPTTWPVWQSTLGW